MRRALRNEGRAPATGPELTAHRQGGASCVQRRTFALGRRAGDWPTDCCPAPCLLGALAQRGQQQQREQEVTQVIGSQVRLKAVGCRLPGCRHGKDAGVVDEHVQGQAAGAEGRGKLPHRLQRGQVQLHDLQGSGRW